jgi:alkylhydroperoxidase family enzyme
LKFARKIVAARGQVGVGDLNAVREAGWDDAAIVEVVAHVALNTFTNYFNNVVDTDLDFPRAEKLETVEKACASGACPV